MPVYLRPMAPTAPNAILCGDPARALMIAQEVLVEPRMSNHHRGLWGYHGRTEAGSELTIQATGIGAPSAAVVLGELLTQGVRAAIRVGTCHGPIGGPPIGAAVLADPITPKDGFSASLGSAGKSFEPDPDLAQHLDAATTARLELVGCDRIDGGANGRSARGGSLPDGGLRDLQSGALAALASDAGIPFAVAVIVAVGDGGRLQDEPLEAAALRLARSAAAAPWPPARSSV